MTITRQSTVTPNCHKADTASTRSLGLGQFSLSQIAARSAARKFKASRWARVSRTLNEHSQLQGGGCWPPVASKGVRSGTYGLDLHFASEKLDRGHYQIRPPSTIPARQALPFTIADKHLVQGSVVYIPSDGKEARGLLEYEFIPSFRPGGPHSRIASELDQRPERFTQDREDDGEAGLRFILKQLGPPPSPQSFVSRVLIVNDTGVVLHESAESVKGVFVTKPPQAIPPRQSADFDVRSP